MQDSEVWILRTVRKILRENGPESAKRFIQKRGGSAKWEVASREIARASIAVRTKINNLERV